MGEGPDLSARPSGWLAGAASGLGCLAGVVGALGCLVQEANSIGDDFEPFPVLVVVGLPGVLVDPSGDLDQAAFSEPLADLGGDFAVELDRHEVGVLDHFTVGVCLLESGIDCHPELDDCGATGGGVLRSVFGESSHCVEVVHCLLPLLCLVPLVGR